MTLVLADPRELHSLPHMTYQLAPRVNEKYSARSKPVPSGDTVRLMRTDGIKAMPSNLLMDTLCLYIQLD